MTVLPQERLIARVRELCRADQRLDAALTYGSFVNGEGDEHSDVEFWLFVAPGAVIGERAWIEDVGPVRHVVLNESGAHVAFLPGLLRGEFHFSRDVGEVASWPARSAPTPRMLLVDRTGELRRVLDRLPAEPPLGDLDEIGGRLVNWLTLAHHVTRRGELMRAADALGHAQRHLLWLVRRAEDRTQHWLTPSRAAERDLPAELVAALHRTTATADPASLTAAIAATWSCARRYWTTAPAALVADLDHHLGPAPS